MLPYFVLVSLLIVGAYGTYILIQDTPSEEPATEKQQTQTSTSNLKKSLQKKTESPYVIPIAEFNERATKKQFGLYVTPSNSPTPPEKFSGYHTGVDVEYSDVTKAVPIRAISDGTVAYSGWVSGYGGVVLITHGVKGAPRTVLYGHLSTSSLPAVGDTVKKSQKIGQLGEDRSSDTDGERKHLHFALLSGARQDFRGYVAEKSQLSGWLDPLSLY